jgi:hypothetical protein
MDPKSAKMLRYDVKCVVVPLKIVRTISNKVLAPFIESHNFRPMKFHHFVQPTNEKMAPPKKQRFFFLIFWECPIFKLSFAPLSILFGFVALEKFSSS